MPSNHASRELLTIREAAPLLGVSRSRLYQMIARREITHFRVGPKKILFSLADINAYLDDKRVEASALAAQRFTHSRS